jgi:hypothetical protein
MTEEATVAFRLHRGGFRAALLFIQGGLRLHR